MGPVAIRGEAPRRTRTPRHWLGPLDANVLRPLEVPALDGLRKFSIVRAEVLYDDIISGRSEMLTGDAVVEFITDRAQVETGKNPVVQRELEVHLASRNLERTMMGLRTWGILGYEQDTVEGLVWNSILYLNGAGGVAGAK